MAGVKIVEPYYCVGPLPGRKQVSINRVDSGGVRQVAFFKREQEARDFMAFLDRMAHWEKVLEDWHGWGTPL